MAPGIKITPHPDQHKIASKLVTLGNSLDVSFSGELFRFINPTYSKAADIVDGRGALHASGRWHVRGAARLSYTAMTPHTALAETLAHVNYYSLPQAKALPRVLVALRLQARRVLDLRDGHVRKTLRLSADTIQTLDWRADNQNGREAVTQAWGGAFASAGFEAVIVPSAADATGSNVLVYPENLKPGSHFESAAPVEWPGK
ncbi:RES family NAD+ phosphorylase [Prosthecobacter vanneervenii]|nr:RES family NAD+ phosphorylase [Prosthecobacter vanneervenii]